MSRISLSGPMLAALLALCAPAGWAQAAQIEAERLISCLSQVETDPDAAYEAALAWSFEGNRPGARQCTALALVALGNPEEGARRLENLATASDGGSVGQRAVYFAQAGHAWLQARAGNEAITAFSEAIRISPEDSGLRLDRAAAYLMSGRDGEALGDLDLVLELRPADLVARQMRAEVYLNTDQPGAALADIHAALDVDPENIDTLLLRGRARESLRLREAGNQSVE